MKIYIIESSVCGVSHPVAASTDDKRANEVANMMSSGDSKHKVVEVELID